MSMMVSFVLSFFPRDVLDEILNLIESVSEDFPSYFRIPTIRAWSVLRENNPLCYLNVTHPSVMFLLSRQVDSHFLSDT